MRNKAERITVYIPTAQCDDNRYSVPEAIRTLSWIVGGVTKVPSIGGWLNGTKWVEEPVTLHVWLVQPMQEMAFRPALARLCSELLTAGESTVLVEYASVEMELV